MNLAEEELAEISEFKTDGINHWLEPVELPITEKYDGITSESANVV